jgi:hypothetical protein
MAPADRPSQRDRWRRGKTPAEKAEEAADVQRRLKREAAERRETAAAKRPTGSRDTSSRPS